MSGRGAGVVESGAQNQRVGVSEGCVRALRVGVVESGAQAQRVLCWGVAGGGGGEWRVGVMMQSSGWGWWRVPSGLALEVPRNESE